MTKPRRDPYGPRNRLLMFVSSLCVVFGCLVLAVKVGHHWSWGLFVWGLVIGVAAIACFEAMFKLMVVVTRASAADVAKFKRQLVQRKQTLYPIFAAYGVAVGILSAGLDSIWPDVFWMAGVIASEVVFPLAAYPLIKRRARLIKHDSGGAEGGEAR